MPIMQRRPVCCPVCFGVSQGTTLQISGFSRLSGSRKIAIMVLLDWVFHQHQKSGNEDVIWFLARKGACFFVQGSTVSISFFIRLQAPWERYFWRITLRRGKFFALADKKPHSTPRGFDQSWQQPGRGTTQKIGGLGNVGRGIRIDHYHCRASTPRNVGQRRGRLHHS